MQLSKTIQIPVPPVLEYIGLGPEPRVPNGSLCMCKRELSAEEADRPCSDFGNSRLLVELNKGRPSDKQLTLRNGVREAIQFLITYNHDFGVASAFFRLIDSNTFPSGQLEQFFIQHQKELNFQRVPGNGRIIQDESGQDVIVDPYDVKPRRIWDLYSNRVIPFRWFELLSIAGNSQQEATAAHAPSINLGVIGEITRSCSRSLGVISRATSMTRDRIQDITSNQQRYPTWEELSDMGNLTVASLMSLGIRRTPTTALPTMPCSDFWAISHSWVKLCSRQYISSTVNQHQWKIPIPLGVTIEDIRQDLRSHDAEYCWLDILCLRQKLEASDPDALAKNEVADMEHQIDVPTIGNVYKQAVKVLYYFNGLRQPLRTTGLDDTRHWLNRAWTLQEIVEPQYSFTMEDVTGELRDALYRNCQMLYQFPNKVYGTWTPAKQQVGISTNHLIPIVREMARRSSESALDKICGLGYILGLKQIPTFSSSQTPESAWQHLVRNLGYELKLELLFRYPHPGPDAGWAPTWSQVVAYQPTCTPSRNLTIDDYMSRLFRLPKVDKRCQRFVVAVKGRLTGVMVTQGSSAGILNVKYTDSRLTSEMRGQVKLVDTTMRIPDGEYAILDSTYVMDGDVSALCRVASVSCEAHKDRSFEKVAAIEVLTKRMHARVRALGALQSRLASCCFT